MLLQLYIYPPVRSPNLLHFPGPPTLMTFPHTHAAALAFWVIQPRLLILFWFFRVINCAQSYPVQLYALILSHCMPLSCRLYALILEHTLPYPYPYLYPYLVLLPWWPFLIHMLLPLLSESSNPGSLSCSDFARHTKCTLLSSAIVCPYPFQLYALIQCNCVPLSCSIVSLILSNYIALSCPIVSPYLA